MKSAVLLSFETSWLCNSVSNFLSFILFIRLILFTCFILIICFINFVLFMRLYFLHILYFSHLGCYCVQLFTAWREAVHKVLSALTVLNSWHFVPFLYYIDKLSPANQTKWIKRRGLSGRWIGWCECESDEPTACKKCFSWGCRRKERYGGGVPWIVGFIFWSRELIAKKQKFGWVVI